MTESNALKKVKKFISENNLAVTDEITVALSGGADSVTLLHILKSLGYDVSAVHVNHGIRGDEAQRDEDFCRTLCEKLDVEFVAVKIDVPGNLDGRSLETAARDMRYEVLAHYGYVATAHTASDNFETLIYNLSRGTGLCGMCGIPSLIKKGETVYIRPLLCLTRDEVERYCKENMLSFVTDSTNLEDDCTRNRIRHFVVPEIKNAVNSSAENAALRASRLMGDDAQCLDMLAQQYEEKLVTNSSFSCYEINKLHRAIASRIVINMLPSPSYKNVEAVLALCGSSDVSGSVNLANNMVARREYDRLIIEKCKISAAFKKCKLQNGVTVLSDGNTLNMGKCLKKDVKFNRLFTKMYFDLDKIEEVLFVRPRRTGDKMLINGINKSLKKLMIEKKIPFNMRESLPVVECAGTVIGVFGIGTADKFRINKDSKNIIYIDYEGKNNGKCNA